MAYTAAQRKQHIYELQTYLHAIALMDSSIPLVIPDGFYGNETVLAVKAFQRKYGLPDTGNTDSATWNKIVSVYRSYQHSIPEPYAVFPSEKYVCSKGDKGQVVYVIQSMLKDIGKRYDNAPDVDVCGAYNDSTAEAVSRFQRWCGLPQTGKVDSGTWNMLVRCCEMQG
ncbi:MAG: peptidoglycan-binding protein [Ruminococcus sp.]|nr:peptidoglycan-binding protein [Ruminococcus sp.]